MERGGNKVAQSGAQSPIVVVEVTLRVRGAGVTIETRDPGDTDTVTLTTGAEPLRWQVEPLFWLRSNSRLTREKVVEVFNQSQAAIVNGVGKALDGLTPRTRKRHVEPEVEREFKRVLDECVGNGEVVTKAEFFDRLDRKVLGYWGTNKERFIDRKLRLMGMKGSNWAWVKRVMVSEAQKRAVAADIRKQYRDLMAERAVKK